MLRKTSLHCYPRNLPAVDEEGLGGHGFDGINFVRLKSQADQSADLVPDKSDNRTS